MAENSTKYISQIGETTDSEDVKKVLAIATKEGSMIKLCDQLEKCTLAHLAATTNILLSFKDQFPSAWKKLNSKLLNKTKKDYSLEIVKFFREIMPSTCRKCDAEYVPLDEAASCTEYIQCVLCEKTEHSCYNKSHIDENSGIVYICECCQKLLGKVSNVPKVMKIAPEPHEEKVEIDDKNAPEEKERGVDAKEGRDVLEVPEKTKVCILYQEGKCPHGLVGRNCPDKHPPHCRYHCGAGNCRRGKECYFLHPKLCANSVQTRTCYNDDCTKTHLKGTRRVNKIPQQEYQTRETHIQEDTNYRKSSVNVWQNSESRKERGQPTKKVYQTSNTENPLPSEDFTKSFLVKCLEGVKSDLSKELTMSVTDLFKKFREETQMNMMPKLTYQVPSQVYGNQAPMKNQIQDIKQPNQSQTSHAAIPMIYPNIAQVPMMTTY